MLAARTADTQSGLSLGRMNRRKTVTLTTFIFLINVIVQIECNETLCANPTCVLKPGNFCVDTETCDVLYCSTMWYSWAQITRHKCLNIDQILYEKFYAECFGKGCPV